MHPVISGTFPTFYLDTGHSVIRQAEMYLHPYSCVKGLLIKFHLLSEDIVIEVPQIGMGFPVQVNL